MIFSRQLLVWYDKHGRQDLPWRHSINPYRVWLSEIMLQQTQVKTVIGYFNCFILEFPTVIDLANADADHVLHLWSGLGYYSRARNLHQTAKLIRDKFQGEFPSDIQTLQTLPGIGRSTAGAIAAIAFNQSAPILDGNVKRVLSRFFALEGWSGLTENIQLLWNKATELTPAQRANDYTQAIMDLGATICSRSRPDCPACPVKKHCQAHQLNLTAKIPAPKPKHKIPARQTVMLILENGSGDIFLQKRPPAGIWGGLWCLPVCDPQQDIQAFCKKHLGLKPGRIEKLESFRHSFSHYHLDIFPVRVTVETDANQVQEIAGTLWYNSARPCKLGLAAPIKKLLKGLDDVKKTVL